MTLGAVYDFAEDKDGVLYAGSTDYLRGLGGLYQSIDFGNTWKYIGLQHHGITSLAITSNDDLLIGYYTDTIGYAGIINFNKLTTSFERLVYSKIEVYDLVVDTNNNIYWATKWASDSSLIIKKSTDNGLNWEGFSKGLDEEVKKIYLADNGDMYVINQLLHAGTYYGGLYKTNEGIYNGVMSKPKPEIQYYPNPVKQAITVKTGLDSGCRLQLYNSIGMLVLTQYSSNGNEVLMDMSGIDLGIYILQVIQNETNINIKIIKE